MSEIQSTEMQALAAKVAEIYELVNTRNMTDHDLLIRLNTMSETVIKDIGELKTNIVSQVAALDSRVRTLEAARWMWLGASGVIGTVAAILVEMFRAGKGG